jgi:hypothetical protein
LHEYELKKEFSGNLGKRCVFTCNYLLNQHERLVLSGAFFVKSKNRTIIQVVIL